MYDFDKKYESIINLINDNAPVKIIANNKNEEEIIVIFNEITTEIEKIKIKVGRQGSQRRRLCVNERSEN